VRQCFAQAASCLLRFGEGELLVACLDALRDGAEQFAALFVGARCPVGEGAFGGVYGGVQFRFACDSTLGDDLAVGGVAHFVARTRVYPFTVDVEPVGLHRCVSFGRGCLFALTPSPSPTGWERRACQPLWSAEAQLQH
jgi:hypothetical protein